MGKVNNAEFRNPDILIKDTQIVDGTGKPAYKGNVAIQGDRIVAVGDTENDADLVIDGSGLVTCPGFIDSHTHADITGMMYPLAENFVMQGVTTVLSGMCGFSLAPRAEDDFFGMDKEEAEDILTWATFGEYLEKVEAGDTAVNIVPVVGHSMIRATVMGQDFRRKATVAEVEEMKKHVVEAMQSGAFGMSTGVDYLPGKFADNEEIAPLVEVVGENGGTYFTHTRFTNWEWPTLDPEEVSHARYLGPPENVGIGVYKGVMEAIDIGKRTGVPVHMAHISNMYMTPQPHPEFLEKATAKASVWVIDKAINEGVDFSFDVVAFTNGVSTKEKLTDAFRSSFYLGDSPRLGWLKQISEKEFIKRLETREFRDRLKRIHESCDLVFGDGVHTKVDPYWMDCFTILRCTHKEYEGKVLGELAREKQIDPLELMFDMMVDDPATLWVQHLDRRGTETMNAVFLSHAAAFPCSDMAVFPANPEKEGMQFGPIDTANPPAGAYGLFPHYINTYSKKLKLFSLEEGIKKATYLPAQRFGLKDRGVLTPGAFADIVIFDLDSITDNTDFLKPAQPPTGIEYVLVNGTIVHRDKVHTGEKPGKVLRHVPTKSYKSKGTK